MKLKEGMIYLYTWIGSPTWGDDHGWSLLLPLFGVILKDRNLGWNGKNIDRNQDVSDVRIRVWHTCPALHAVARPAHPQCCTVSHRLRGHEKQLGYGMEMPTLNWWPSKSRCKHMFNICLVYRLSKNEWNKLVYLSKNPVDFRDPNVETLCFFLNQISRWMIAYDLNVNDVLGRGNPSNTLNDSHKSMLSLYDTLLVSMLAWLCHDRPGYTGQVAPTHFPAVCTISVSMFHRLWVQ